MWQTLDYLLMLVMPGLLALSAFFSGSETALFGMSEAERRQVHRTRGLAARSVEALLAEPRMLLITLMLGNMTINALYFVIGSVLMMRSGFSVLGEAVVGLVTLLAVLLAGEVLPKMVASARRVGFAAVVGPPLLGLHRLILPLRVLVERLVVTPLARLTAPSGPPPGLDAEELRTLLEQSSSQGVIDREEQRVLREVLTIGRLRVRDVMTPRVEMHALPRTATRADVLRVTALARLTRLPVYKHDLDSIVGVLDVKRFLQSPASGALAAGDLALPATFVPQMATLDQLLDEFRRRHVGLAVVVDEFGGTAGIVAMRDVVAELVGEITGEDEIEAAPPVLIGLGRWRVSGALSVHDWAEAFGEPLLAPRVSTLGGLIMDRLGRAPVEGDVVELRNVRLEVEQVDRSRVVTAVVTLTNGAGADEPSPEESP